MVGGTVAAPNSAKASSRAGLLVSEKGCCPDYELYNRVYSFLYLFCRKVTFCNHAMYVIKLFIKVNILHNKRF